MKMDEAKDKIRNIVYNNKEILILIILIVIVFAILLFPEKDSNNFEKEIIKHVQTYVRTNNVPSNKFISLYDLETAKIYTSKGCNKATGVLYNNGKYEAYLMCNDYYSSNIKKLKTKDKYITLIGNAFWITNSKNFQDPGYSLNNNNYKVEVINNYKPEEGLYKIIYIVRDQNGNRKSTLERVVLYSEYNSNYNEGSLRLKGSNPMYVLKGKQYIEPGFVAVDINGNNQSSNVKISGSVNTSIPGTYKITYKLEQVELIREVIVSDIIAIINVDDEEKFVKDAVNLSVEITGKDYDYTIIPSGERRNTNVINYKVTNNGIYTFIIYDKYNNQLKLQQEVNNIDNTIPTGKCVANLNEGKTKVTVSALDEESGIAGYYYNNGKNTTGKQTVSEYTFSNLYENVSVIVEDKVGNKATLVCSKTGDGSYAQILPSSGANIVASDSSDTLKVSIEKTSGYYLTRVWVRDPYNQTQKGVIANWGSKLEKPFDIIQREISNKNLQNKIVVAINASGFYLSGSWSPSCGSSYASKYDRTTEGPLVITNGNVVRNWYSDSAIDKARNHVLYAISPDGTLDTYPNFNKLTENERKNLFDKIISLNYKNTWVFRPVIMQNGKMVNSDILGTFLDGSAKRQVLCQINYNNFAILSTTSSYNKNGLNSILTSLNCQTAVNMDGGGSVALLYKGKNGTLTTLVGGSRPLVDTLYFTEK